VPTSPTDAELRRRAAAIAGHTGDVDGARLAANDPDATVRAIGLGALARLEQISQSDLIGALFDPEVVVRRRALELAATYGAASTSAGYEIDAAIITILQGDRDDEAEIAAWCLGERHQAPEETEAEDLDPENFDPEDLDEAADRHLLLVVRALATMATDHAEPLCREAAVAALGSIGHDAGLPAILVAVTDKATVRRRAVVALAPFDGPEVHQALVKARVDRDWQVRQAAEDLLRLES
jgi:hypothetical protein